MDALYFYYTSTGSPENIDLAYEAVDQRQILKCYFIQSAVRDRELTMMHLNLLSTGSIPVKINNYFHVKVVFKSRLKKKTDP